MHCAQLLFVVNEPASMPGGGLDNMTPCEQERLLVMSNVARTLAFLLQLASSASLLQLSEQQAHVSIFLSFPVILVDSGTQGPSVSQL